MRKWILDKCAYSNLSTKFLLAHIDIRYEKKENVKNKGVTKLLVFFIPKKEKELFDVRLKGFKISDLFN